MINIQLLKDQDDYHKKNPDVFQLYQQLLVFLYFNMEFIYYLVIRLHIYEFYK